MANNPYNNKIQLSDGTTLIDLTSDTVTAANLAQGVTAHDASGAPITGTMSGGGVIITDTTDSHGGTIREITTSNVLNVSPLSVTQNGTYTAQTGSAYSPVTVNVSGGGSSSYTKIIEKTYTVNTTSTSVATLEELNTGHPEIYGTEKWVYVRVRDTVGKRAGYFYGTDNWLYNRYLASDSTYTGSSDTGVRAIWRYDSNSAFQYYGVYGSTGFGVFADQILSDGSIRIRARYSSSYTLTVDSTYKVEIYLLNTPDGVQPLA